MDEPSSRLRILQVSTADTLGGAEGVAWDLFRSYRARGYESWLVVGRKRSGEPAVFPLSGGAGGFLRTKSWQATKDRLRPLARRMGGAARIKNAARSVEHPVWAWERSRGREDFDFPAT